MTHLDILKEIRDDFKYGGQVRFTKEKIYPALDYAISELERRCHSYCEDCPKCRPELEKKEECEHKLNL